LGKNHRSGKMMSGDIEMSHLMKCWMEALVGWW